MFKTCLLYQTDESWPSRVIYLIHKWGDFPKISWLFLKIYSSDLPELIHRDIMFCLSFFKGNMI